MKILRLVFNPFGVNTYIVYDPDTMECAIVDPGMIDREEVEQLYSVIERYNLKPVHLINTHLHADHAVGNQYVRDKYDLKLEANKADKLLADQLSVQKRMFGLEDDGRREIIDSFLSDGDEIHIGNGVLKVLEVPGHSPGGIALYDSKGDFAITGDSLFQGSIGRTDLLGGDMTTLLNAVREKLLSLPDDTVVYPGHGNPTTIGQERRFNPFLNSF